MGEGRKINPVVDKTLGILGHAELFEPVRNLLHRGPLADLSSLTDLLDSAAESLPDKSQA
jgi:hypothetical protein